MHNELFKIGPVTIYGYGLMIALGIFFAYRLVAYRASNRQFPLSHVASLSGWCLAGGFAGAKLLFWLTQMHNIVNDPSLLLNFAEGFVVYGGIIGGIGAGFLYCKIHKIKFLKHLDLFVPSIALAQGFGRIGCLLAGCCYGEETSSWFGITFHDSAIAPNGVALVPTQMIESVFSFSLCFLLLYVAKRTTKAGLVAALYLILYGLGRFVIEFYRGDLIRGEVGLFTTSQLIALLVVALTSLAVVLSRYQKRLVA
ncbi:prolipoprotein diacylglyceryl transferase [Paenibacillus kobensis]|uniref:prolipoprotein diacylglyceryl transferase n=1 Tax=Paenibacillus kobensis TaxID=59841 RepID=UPI000FD801E0|nr:prolipoprotein diacylglyceryl transferase [Paenibacillus kobensis]